MNFSFLSSSSSVAVKNFSSSSWSGSVRSLILQSPRSGAGIQRRGEHAFIPP
jgi:hypothetical protein